MRSETVKLIIEISKDYYEILKSEVEQNLTDYYPFIVIGNGIPLDDVIAKLEEHKYSREYCIEHGIDWAIDMGMVRIILNNIGKESEEV